MEAKIRGIIKEHKLHDVEGLFKSALKPQFANDLEISIELGSNEGYYVTITVGQTAYHLRLHCKEAALKTLNVMAQQLLPYY